MACSIAREDTKEPQLPLWLRRSVVTTVGVFLGVGCVCVGGGDVQFHAKFMLFCSVHVMYLSIASFVCHYSCLCLYVSPLHPSLVIFSCLLSFNAVRQIVEASNGKQ